MKNRENDWHKIAILVCLLFIIYSLETFSNTTADEEKKETSLCTTEVQK